VLLRGQPKTLLPPRSLSDGPWHLYQYALDAGAAIILLGNMNSDIHHSALHSFATEHNLHETILLRFPSLPPPATFQQGSQLGTVPIDGAWVLANVKVEAAQWCPIQLSPGDHQAIVLDINLTYCIGDPRYMIVRPPGCQLNSALPSVHNQYLHLLHNFAAQHSLESKLNYLFWLAQSSTTTRPILQQALESFDRMKADGMNCRRFNMGLVQYSPELNLWHCRKNLWLLVLCRKQGHPIKAKYINRLAWACHVLNPLGATLFQTNRALQEATMCYMALKLQHALLRSNFLQSKLHDPSLSEEHHHVISQLISLEVLGRSYCRIHAIKQQSMGHSITAVEYSSPTRTVLATSRSEVEAALSNTLQAHFKGTHGSPFLHAPLLLWLVCLVLAWPHLQSWRVHSNALLASMNTLDYSSKPCSSHPQRSIPPTFPHSSDQKTSSPIGGKQRNTHPPHHLVYTSAIIRQPPTLHPWPFFMIISHN